MKYIYILVFMFSMLVLHGQIVLPHQVIAKYKNGELLVRWEPQTIAEWKISQSGGYIVEHYLVSGDSEQLLSTTKVKPSSIAEWDARMKSVRGYKYDFYKGAKELLYPETSDGAFDEFMSSLKKNTEETLDSFKLNFIAYTANFDIEIAAMSGMGIILPADLNKEYKVKIYIPTLDPMILQIKAQELNPNIPQLVAEFGDRTVNLKWNTHSYRNQYYGYLREESKDGVHFTVTDSIPYVNTLDKDPNKVALHTISINDSLDQNYKDIYYRIRGMDYFGDFHKNASTIKGYGFDKLTTSPMLNFAEQTEDNFAHLKWTMTNSKDELIKDFTIYRADSIDGKYHVDVDTIDRSQREIYIPMEKETNFYRIEVNPINGISMSSMPVFVMGMDTIPPLTPIIIGGTIDTLGRVVITWHKNLERDLWGYKIFKANFDDGEEFALLEATPNIDTFYIDSVDLNFNTERVFYQVQAVDKRNNRSPFSEIIKIEKPDLIPPGMPALSSISQSTDSVIIHWQPSISNDVVEHQVYRKDIYKDKEWTLIAKLDSADFSHAKLPMQKYFVLIDTGGIAEHTYAYTIMALDDAGLRSDVTSHNTFTKQAIKEEFVAFKNIDYTIDSITNKVLITWMPNEQDQLQYVTIYRGPSKGKLGMIEDVNYPSASFSQDYNPKNPLYIRLVPVYKNYKKFIASEVLEINKIPVND